MSDTADIEWIEPYEGFAYKEDTIVVEAQEQTRALTVCGIDSTVYGDKADPSAFISLAIQAGVLSGISSDGGVNMEQSLAQHRPVRLGEPLHVSGRITQVDHVPRGRAVRTEVWFTGEDGVCAITAKRRSLRPDPEKVGTRGAGERPPPIITAVTGLQALGTFVLTPEIVKGYRATGNRIHFDPEAAKRAGFRAPIIGGGMGVHYLMAEIWRQFSPQALELDIAFRRPIFWDDRLTIMVDKADDTWKAICLTKGEKIATEARINHLVSG
jgi:hypothetical protein